MAKTRGSYKPIVPAKRARQVTEDDSESQPASPRPESSQPASSQPASPQPASSQPANPQQTMTQFRDDLFKKHKKMIHAAYNDLDDKRKVIVNNLTSVQVKKDRHGAWVMVKVSSHSAYVTVRRHLDKGWSIEPEQAESLRVLCGGTYTEQLATAFMEQLWNPELVYLPMNDNERKIQDMATFVHLKQKWGLKVTLDAARAAKLSKKSGSNDKGKDSAGVSGDPDKVDSDPVNPTLSKIIDYLEDNRAATQELKHSVDKLTDAADANAADLVSIINGVNDIGSAINETNELLGGILTALDLTQSVSVAAGAPAAGSGNDGHVAQPAPVQNVPANPAGGGSAGLVPLGAPVVDENGSVARTFYDREGVVLQAARGQGNDVTRKVDELSTTLRDMQLTEKLDKVVQAVHNTNQSVKDLHLSGDHDRISILLKTTSNIQEVVVNSFANQTNSLASMRSQFDRQQPQLHHPQPQPMIGDPGFRQSTPSQMLPGQSSMNNNAPGNSSGEAERQQQHSKQTTPAPATTSPFVPSTQQQAPGESIQSSPLTTLPPSQAVNLSTPLYGPPNPQQYHQQATQQPAPQYRQQVPQQQYHQQVPQQQFHQQVPQQQYHQQVPQQQFHQQVPQQQYHLPAIHGSQFHGNMQQFPPQGGGHPPNA